MLLVRCLSVCLSVCMPVCDVRALWPNGWTDHAGRPRPLPHCVTWGPSSPSPKGAQPPIFGPYLLRPNGCMHQDATWYGCRPQPRGLCVRWRSSLPSQKWGRSPPNFRPMFIVAKRLDGSLGTKLGFNSGDSMVDGDPAPSPQSGLSPLPNFRPISIVAKRWMHQDATWYGGRPQPRGLCVRWGLSPLPKRRRSPQFSAHVYCGQTARWIKMALGVEVGVGSVHIVLDGDTASLPKKGVESPTKFRPIFIVAKRLDASTCHLVWR